MEIIKINLNNVVLPNDLVACIGVFDGIHRGHQELIDKVMEIGNKENKKTAIVTFDPHPDFILNKSFENVYITPLDQKIKLIDKMYNIDYSIIVDFNDELASLSYLDFYNLFLKNFSKIIVGYDFRFGYKGNGNSYILKELHHDNVIIIDKIYDEYSHEKIGTKQIIDYLKQGNIEKANYLLGYKYTITGKVIKGSQIGSKIGYPTANIEISDKYCYVKKGVYALNVKINNMNYLGIGNYGINPSFNKIINPRLEIHIFDFNKDIYGYNIEVEFIEFIREETVFPSVDLFLEQLKKDCKYCIEKYGGIYETINCRSDG